MEDGPRGTRECGFRTETKRGPAVFHNAGRARYRASVLLTDHRGLRTEAAGGRRRIERQLGHELETDLDGVPRRELAGRAIARQQYDSKADDAKWEAEGLLADRAQSRLDEEVDKQLLQATEKFRRRFLEPLQASGLRPETVDLETTQERLIGAPPPGRLRPGGRLLRRDRRLSADSLLSVQIHAICPEQYRLQSPELNARETDLPSLFREHRRRNFAAQLSGAGGSTDDVTLRLADRDAITLCCADDRIHVTLRIARLEGGVRRVRAPAISRCGPPTCRTLHVHWWRDGYPRSRAAGSRWATRSPQSAGPTSPGRFVGQRLGPRQTTS